MKPKMLASFAAITFWSTSAYADLQPWKDYTISESVWLIETVMVHAHMDDAYLQGLKESMMKENEIRKQLGQIEEYHLYRSDLFESGSFNFMVVVKFKNSEALAPNKARYEAFFKEWSQQANLMADSKAWHEKFPALRDITGEYYMREITLTK